MRYFSEFATHWRRVISGAIGLSVGMALVAYANGVFAPYLVEEFHWDRAQFALIGSLGVVTLFTIPLAGRLTDKFGVLPVVTVGAIGIPLTFLANSMMNGELSVFFAIMIVQLIIGATTSAAVYTRLVAGEFERARGLALALVISAPAALAAIGSPLLANVIEEHGWRVGYQVLAAFSGAGGLIAILLALGLRTTAAKPAASAQKQAGFRYASLLRNGIFWILLGSMFLCNIPSGLATNQLSLVLIEDGVSAVVAASMLAAYAMGVIVGRFACGIALDHAPAHFVASIGMALPAIGMFLLASDLNAPTVLTVAIVLLGLSQGAEGDMMGFLVARYFGIESYSSVLGLLYSAISAASVLGAVMLSQTLRLTDSYANFLAISGVLVVIGSALLLLLGGKRASAAPAGQTSAAT